MWGMMHGLPSVKVVVSSIVIVELTLIRGSCYSARRSSLKADLIGSLIISPAMLHDLKSILSKRGKAFER